MPKSSFTISADLLQQFSRAFYERTRVKVAASIVLGAVAMMSLGFCTAVAGWSAATYQEKELLPDGTDDKVLHAYESLISGWGFASFMYIMAFVVFAIIAMYASPICCGSSNEWRMVKGPTEIYMNDNGIDEMDGLIGQGAGSSEVRPGSAVAAALSNVTPSKNSNV